MGVPMRNVESYGGAVTRSPLADELRSLAQLRMLHSLAQRLNELNDVRQIGEAITAELHTVIEYHNCRVHLLSEDGQMLVEYGLLLAHIAIIVIVALLFLGPIVSRIFQNVGSNLSGT